LKVQIIGDSFGLPRFYYHDGFDFENYGKPEAGKVIQLRYEDTYPEKVRSGLINAFPDDDIIIINDCMQVNNSYVLGTEFKSIFLHDPDYIVIQLGVVDCSPRDAQTEAPFPFMQGKSPWVSIDEFYNNLRSFVQICVNKIKNLKAIVLVNIVKGTEDFYTRHPGTLEFVLAYNKVISDLSGMDFQVELNGVRRSIKTYLADMFEITNDIGWKALCTDGVHINATGSQLVANEIVSKISYNETNFVTKTEDKIENSNLMSEEIRYDLMEKIDRIREQIARGDNNLSIELPGLFDYIMDNGLINPDNSKQIQEIYLIVEDCRKVMQTGKYIDLANIVECRIKMLLGLSRS